MKYRSFFAFFVMGILAVTAFYFFADGRMVRKEYEEYRDGMFARAYETVLGDLGAYLKEEDGAAASRIVSGLSALPLSEGEVETVRRFSEDMTRGLYDGEAKERALRYGEALYRYLSGNRSRSYQKSWRASGMGLPDYPERSQAASAVPEESEGALLRDQLANRLLNRKKTVAYQRQWDGVTVYGYRTASSYAEMSEDGRLIRYLRAVEEDVPYDGKDAEEKAIAFLKEYRWDSAVLSKGERRDNTVIFSFDHHEGNGMIGAGPDGVFLFRVTGK